MTQHDRRQVDAAILVSELFVIVEMLMTTYLGSSPLLLLLLLLGHLLLQLLHSHAKTDHKHSSHRGTVVEFLLVKLNFCGFDLLRVLVDCAVREGVLRYSALSPG